MRQIRLPLILTLLVFGLLLTSDVPQTLHADAEPEIISGTLEDVYGSVGLCGDSATRTQRPIVTILLISATIKPGRSLITMSGTIRSSIFKTRTPLPMIRNGCMAKNLCVPEKSGRSTLSGAVSILTLKA